MINQESTNKKRGLYIRKLRKLKGWTQIDFGEKLGKAKGSISGYENGLGISLSTLKEMATLLGVTEGDILSAGGQISESQSRDVNPGSFNGNLYVKANTMWVPLVNQYAYAGYMGGFSDEEWIGDLPKFPFPVEDRTFKGNYMAFEVKGDSMDDGTTEGYQSGVIVLGRQIEQHHWRNKLHINQWDFIIVHRTDGILIKRIIEHDVQNGILTLHSLNEYYEDFQVELNDVVQIFNVISMMSNRRR